MATIPPQPILDDLVDRLEEAWSAVSSDEAGPAGIPQLSEFLPVGDDSESQSAAVELMRVDMERRWVMAPSDRWSLQDYCNQYPWLSDNKRLLAELAFEEYRLRQDHQEAVRPEKYASQFGIDVTNWPVEAEVAKDTSALRRWNESTIDLLESSTDQLVNSLSTFPQVGDRLGDFLIREQIGSGKFSHVYLAKQGELADRPIVLKVSADLGDETNKLARLQHTNIVPIYSLHRMDELQAICMPFLGRDTLRSLLRTGSITGTGLRLGKEWSQNRDELALCDFFAQIADGLQHAHERKIVHRDLKPANILVSDEGTPLVLDFNLSEDLVVGGAASLLVGGTRPYMAPEHLKSLVSRDRMDQRCDLFSLGVILFEACIGETPFPRRDGSFLVCLTQLIKDRQRDEWKTRLKQTASPDLVAMIDKCLAPKVDDRYQTAGELAEDLRRHAANRSLKHAENTSWKQRLSKWITRNRHRVTLGSLTTVGVLILAASMALTAMFARRSQRLEADQRANAFQQEYAEAQLGLALAKKTSLLASAIEIGESAVSRFADGADWQNRHPFRSLSPPQQKMIAGDMSDLLSLLGEYDPSGPSKWQRFASVAPANQPHDSPPSEYVSIARLIGQGDYEQAAERVEARLSQHPTDAAAWLQRGFCDVQASELSAAELAFTRCIALYPNSIHGYFSRGLVRLSRQDHEAARDDFSRVLDLRPGTHVAHFNRAVAWHRLGQHHAALEDCDTALAGAKHRCRALALRFHILTALDRGEEARLALKQAMETTPEDAYGFIDRGNLLIDENPELAVDDFLKALDLRPNALPALQNLAHLYADVLRDHDAAMTLLSDFGERYPHHPVPVAGQAVILAREGKETSALEAADRALAMDDSARTLYQVASVHALLSDQHPEHATVAIRLLKSCFRKDIEWFDTIVTDSDFIPLRQNQDYLKLLAATKLLSQH